MPFSPFDLSSKVALITGGNSGIGLGLAEGLAQAGASIVTWGTNETKNRDAEAKLLKHGVRVMAQRVDVAQEDQVVAAMADAVAAMGRVDFVAANAGIGGGGPFAELTTEAWRRVTAVNLDGVFWTLREACKHMVERGKAGDAGGSLVVTSSVSAVHGAPRNEAYASTKGAVLALVRGLAGRVRPPRRAGERHRARLDPLRHDRGGPELGHVQREGDRPRACWSLGRAGRLLRHRRLPRLGRLALPHRRHLRDRRRLHGFLSAPPDARLTNLG